MFNRELTIRQVQTNLGLKVDGVDGPHTWTAILQQVSQGQHTKKSAETTVEEVSTVQGFSPRAYALILKYEIGGGKEYYNKALKRPTYPGGASGVTIGIGYDLGYNSAAQFKADWFEHLDQPTYLLLSSTLGKKGESAKALIGKLRGVSIPYDTAEHVFQTSTLPRFIQETKQAFPGAESLHPDAFGALVSLVFNRGGSVSGPRRLEMNNIRRAIAGSIKTENLYVYIADQFVAMKRLWVGQGLDGLLTRRDEEAKLIHSCA